MRRIAILGSTGSVGRATLSVVLRHPDCFKVVAVCARRSVDELAGQVAEYGIPRAVLTDAAALGDPDRLPRADWRAGPDEVTELVADPEVDVVVNAIVGSVGLRATLAALRAGKRLALANKESLVAGGPLVMAAVREGGGELIPVDSEHSAILQCLEGCEPSSVVRLVITASGGPFRRLSREQLVNVGPREALRHPTWSMGPKITIDSATLANKALEVIEARFLYDIGYDRIDAVIHPQSVVHSFVELCDGSVLAQLGFPTMELPILYALSHPDRIPDPALRTFDPVKSSPLTFEEVDPERFPLFALGVHAGEQGGTTPAVYNAANEVAVEAFLRGDVRFLEMADVVAYAVDHVPRRNVGVVDDVLEADAAGRVAARDYVSSLASMAHGLKGRRAAE